MRRQQQAIEEEQRQLNLVTSDVARKLYPPVHGMEAESEEDQELIDLPSPRTPKRRFLATQNPLLRPIHSQPPHGNHPHLHPQNLFLPHLHPQDLYLPHDNHPHLHNRNLYLPHALAQSH